ncbi:CopD family protein [Variovorax rhizosphaerae]|uniref:CopD family protein n=1 Tax=Variovorax rhizosphaerae TaxID=1836200 RepID=A0ABU8WK24_9BURK
MSLMFAVLLFLHLASAAFWVGGMAVMHFAVRPAAVAVLEPPLRLPMLSAALGRFFVGVNVAIVLLLLSGFAMIGLAGGMGALRWHVHAMLGIGLLMMAVYGHIRFGIYPKVRRAIAVKEWPVAARRLHLIRMLVALNLALGVLVFALAVVGRAG